MINRRESIKIIVVGALMGFGSIYNGASQAFFNGDYYPFFYLPRLPYGLNALEPYLDRASLEQHYSKLHVSYIKKLNEAVSSIPSFYYSILDRNTNGENRNLHHLEKEQDRLSYLLQNADKVPEKVRKEVRDNAGGHYNHSLFWLMMKPNGGGNPSPALTNAMVKEFGSVDAFKKKFSEAAEGISGNGWAWLTLDGKKLRIETTPNEDTPLSSGRQVVLGLDVWEHAYDLQYQGKRSEYIAAWFHVVNWEFVSERFAKFKM